MAAGLSAAALAGSDAVGDRSAEASAIRPLVAPYDQGPYLPLTRGQHDIKQLPATCAVRVSGMGKRIGGAGCLS